MISKGQNERQHDHRQQRKEPKLNLYRSTGRGHTVFVIILTLLAVLFLSGTVWYLSLQRQVVILTDPVWKSAYLEPEHTVEQLKINLLNLFYIPRIVTIPFDRAGQAEIEAICRSREGAWFLLSPYLSSFVEPEKLLQACSGSNFVVWETAAGSRIDSQDALSSTLSSELSSGAFSEPSSDKFSDLPSELFSNGDSQLTVLYLDPQRLARAMVEGLKPLLASSKSSPESSSESSPESSSKSNGQPLQLVWSRDGKFPKDFALGVQAEITAQLPGLEVKLVDTSERNREGLNRAGLADDQNSPEINSEALLAILDGKAEELQELLSRIENRGARAVVFGDGALSGWPAGVKAEINVNIKTTFIELIKLSVKSPKEASAGRFAVRFQVSR